MSKFLRLALPIALVFAPLTALAAPQWVQAGTGDDGTRMMVDTSSIQGRGRYRYYWKEVILNEPFELRGRMALSYQAWESVDCQSGMFRERETYWLDRNGQVIRQDKPGDRGELKKANPITVQGSVVRFVCGRN